MWWMPVLMILLTACSSGTGASSARSDTGSAGHVPPGRPQAQPAAMPAHRLTVGEVLFIRNCAGCHGAGAHGDGPVGAALSLHPRNLREAGLFPEDRDPAWVNRILHGRAMPVSIQPAQEVTTGAEVDNVLGHLRRFPTLKWNDIARGEKVYDSLCLSCHGVYGHGDGPLAETLPTRPRDLAAPLYQQQVSDEMLFQRISDGHGAMPATADVLSADDRQAVVRFIRLLTPGYEAYDRYCVGCHGTRGQPVSREILDILGLDDTWQPPPPLDKEFFQKRTDEQLRKSIRRMLTLNRAPMPHFAGDLTADQVRQILGYLRTLPPEP
jgi:mono/diheme cytochrome c family protein